MSPETTVTEALAGVMRDVQAVRKSERNNQQGFNFRGIDSVINAVGPALREHGVIFLPVAEQLTSEAYETSRGTAMRNVTVKVTWTIVGPRGDTLTACTYGEASDSGDKAASKAASVAYRTALLQVLCIPTDEIDVDAQSHERAAQQPPRTIPPSERALAWGELWRFTEQREADLTDDQRRDYIVGELKQHQLDGSKAEDLRQMIKILSAVEVPA